MRKPIFRCLKTIALLMLLGATAEPARADLILNGNFGTGDFTSWSLAGDSSSAYVSSGQLAGSTYQAALTTNADDQGFLTQGFTSAIGQEYQLSFLLGGDGATPNSFSASLGANTLVNLTNIPDNIPGGQSYTVDYTATSTTTTLSFAFDDAPGYLYLTNVSVNPLSTVPEPASIIGVGLGSLMMMGYGWRKSRKALKGRIA